MNSRQFFDPDSSTYSYLLWDEDSREAALIDSVDNQVDRDAQIIRELELKLVWLLETHIHADHVTGAGKLRRRFPGARIAVHAASNARCANLLLEDSDTIKLGAHSIDVLYTPGHTDTDVCYRIEGAVFTGDTLLIRGSGRTDFQSGDPGRAYDSITRRLFTLPTETIVYPAHDYQGRTQSTIGEEIRFNPRLMDHRSRDEYIHVMESMDLPKPGRIDEAVPGNQVCGL